MIYRHLTSQKGFSLIKILIALIVLALAVLYFLPPISGNQYDIVNTLSAKAKAVISNIVSKLRITGKNISDRIDATSTKVSRKLKDLSDKWNLKKFSELISGVEQEWEDDMDKLISVSKARGFAMGQIEQRRDQYRAGNTSWRRVESEYWEQLREQTENAITESIARFRTRPLGCSDFTNELKIIWEISNQFNEDTFEGYFEAKQLSEELQQPRSEQFLTNILKWLATANVYSAPGGNWAKDWFIQQLNLAITKTSEGYNPDYPAIIEHIDSQFRTRDTSIYQILRDIVVAEIYLNYDLINPAEDRFDEAIRNLSQVVANSRYDQYSMTALGLHMALGLLHERVCKNVDLAIKEFKEVIAIARRLDLRCEDYSIAHYHLGIINLGLRAEREIQPTFEEKINPYAATTQTILAATPTPEPTPIPTPTSKPITVTIEIPRSIEESGSRPERPAEGSGEISPPTVPASPGYTGVVKGEIQPGEGRRPERDIRLRPRAELGETRRMKKFEISDLYNLNNIPDDAAREFELFLRCNKEGDQAEIARFIHRRYLGR